jgi:four helix bundle protein
MDRQEMKERTRAFALRVVKLVQALPRNQMAKVLGNQLLRAGTAVGANYRAAQRARTAREFDAKLGIVEEECDETAYWMDLIVEAGLITRDRLSSLLTEADELTAIIVTARKNSRH